MTEDETHRIGEALTATISAHGAELHSIRTAAGAELLWQAGPAWPRHAPVLFPIVGRLAEDTLIHEGVPTRMTQHGFARDRRFDFVSRERDACRLRLDDDAQSRAIYPFAFELEIDYRIEGPTLTVGYTVSNPSTTLLPASLGAHPAFLWPLTAGLPRQAHAIIFEQPEPAPVRRVEDGLLRPDTEPSPIRGRTLALDDALFTNDALILEAPASRSLRYGVAGGPGLRIAWSGFHQLGLWSKPGAGFLCIEPWSGLASPRGFAGEFRDKPHLMRIPPGASRHSSWSVTVESIA
ncbi:aldose 1-epimerase family protein [Lichenicoccus sp.]|uniref:aldose 1-epimerase family protein n=1 Tax=Lichenicoccus sp. TaxID=2781899 RepID=UPI003D09D489